MLVTDTTVYGATRMEEALLRWGQLPKPWLVWVADAPMCPVQDARFMVRNLGTPGRSRAAAVPVRAASR